MLSFCALDQTIEAGYLTRTTFQDVGVSKQYHPHYERAALAAAIRSQ
jgi:hypothetical protein